MKNQCYENRSAGTFGLRPAPLLRAQLVAEEDRTPLALNETGCLAAAYLPDCRLDQPWSTSCFKALIEGEKKYSPPVVITQRAKVR